MNTTAILIPPDRKAAEVHAVVADVVAMLKMRSRRPDTTAVRMAAIGEVMHWLESGDEQFQNPFEAVQTELFAAGGKR